jgi:DNA gyrase/topoisomerase IV subunit B
MSVAYSEEHIKTLEWREHIRLRPGMYIGKLGDGSSQDDGVYVLLKEVMDNAVDEYMMGKGYSAGETARRCIKDEHRSKIRFEGFQKICRA